MAGSSVLPQFALTLCGTDSTIDRSNNRPKWCPLSEGFYWIWHYIIGIANRELVTAGLFADPYAPDHIFQGFIPAVYPLRVAQGKF